MEEKKSNFSTILIVLLLIGISVLGSLFYDTKKELSSQVMYAEALQDSIRTWVDINGYQVAQISNIEAENDRLFLSLKSSDSTIVSLQNEVITAKKKGGMKQPGSSVTVVERETKVETTVSSQVTEVDSTNKIFEIRSEFNLDGWVMGSVVARPDSTEINLQVYDDFTVRLDYEPQGFLGLGKPKPFTELISKNPHSATKVLRTYKVTTPPEPNIVFGPSVSWGWGGWVAGFSAVYPLVKFRL